MDLAIPPSLVYGCAYLFSQVYGLTMPSQVNGLAKFLALNILF